MLVLWATCRCTVHRHAFPARVNLRRSGPLRQRWLQRTWFASLCCWVSTGTVLAAIRPEEAICFPPDPACQMESPVPQDYSLNRSRSGHKSSPLGAIVLMEVHQRIQKGRGLFLWSPSRYFWDGFALTTSPRGPRPSLTAPTRVSSTTPSKNNTTRMNNKVSVDMSLLHPLAV